MKIIIIIWMELSRIFLARKFTVKYSFLKLIKQFSFLHLNNFHTNEISTFFHFK